MTDKNKRLDKRRIQSFSFLILAVGMISLKPCLCLIEIMILLVSPGTLRISLELKVCLVPRDTKVSEIVLGEMTTKCV